MVWAHLLSLVYDTNAPRDVATFVDQVERTESGELRLGERARGPAGEASCVKRRSPEVPPALVMEEGSNLIMTRMNERPMRDLLGFY
jgi:hypothetical protein